VKPNLVKPNFHVRYAEHLIHIGAARYAVFGEIEGEAVFRVQECDYKTNNGVKQPPKMIKCNLQQWVDLTANVDAINEAIADFDIVKLHIGGNTYVRVQPDRRRVDIREYFLPAIGNCNLDMLPNAFEPFLIPTRRGISLTYEEWTELSVKAMPLIHAGAKQLQTVRLGSCSMYHDAQTSWLKCSHCNPNGHLHW
jgi:hypothetical protein